MIIPARFNGPPDSANGGYTAGMLANYRDVTATEGGAVGGTRGDAPVAGSAAEGITPADDVLPAGEPVPDDRHPPTDGPAPGQAPGHGSTPGHGPTPAPGHGPDPTPGRGPDTGAGQGATTAVLRPTAPVLAGGPVQAVVTLRRPPPLNTPLSLTRNGDELALYAGSQLIAEATPLPETEPLIEAVPPVSYAEALAAAERFPGLVSHPFPTCFVCGPAHPDGLRLFAGRLPDGRTAAAWRVPADVSPVMVWAALDCPGGWSVPMDTRPYVLGQLAGRVEAVPAPGDECVIMGRTVAVEGRKAWALSTLYGPEGVALARARALWIALAERPAVIAPPGERHRT